MATPAGSTRTRVLPFYRRSGARVLLAGLAVAVIAGLALALTPRDKPEAHLSPLPAISVPSLASSDLFVSASGHDGATGSAADPLGTIQAAVDRVTPGETVWVEPGTYAGFDLSRSNDAGRPITVAARSAGTVILTPADGRSTIDLTGADGVILINLVVEGPGDATGDAIRLDHSTDVTIEGSTIRGTRGGVGIEVRFSANVTIRGNDILHNAMGVRLFGEGDPASVHDVLIEDNRIHDNDSMVVDDPAPDNDYGANGIVWHKVTGPTVAIGNQVWGNRAPSHDYGTDGGAFEIWGSSNVVIEGNVAWDNDNVVETGSDGPQCENISFRRNVAYAVNFGVGLILRCARDSLVANNVFDGLRNYAFELSDRSSGTSFARSIDGLRIVDNIVVGSLAYAIRNDLPASVVLDYNLLPGGRFVARLPGGVTSTIFDLRRATGQEQHGIAADPMFVDPAARDYRLRPGSPAIDRGSPPGPGASFLGSAPDIGVYEGAAVLPSPSPADSR
jgi:hypothetical protein